MTGKEQGDVAQGVDESSPTFADELRNTREVAKGWWQGVTGLFGLFSVGTVIFAADAVGGLGNFGKVAFAVAAFAAAVLSGLAIVAACVRRMAGRAGRSCAAGFTASRVKASWALHPGSTKGKKSNSSEIRWLS